VDLGGLLRSLGLEQYEGVFRDKAIDETVLHDLTEDHLRELDIPLGVRLKLRRRRVRVLDLCALRPSLGGPLFTHRRGALWSPRSVQ
jgi:hypothetical protein